MIFKWQMKHEISFNAAAAEPCWMLLRHVQCQFKVPHYFHQQISTYNSQICIISPNVLCCQLSGTPAQSFIHHNILVLWVFPDNKWSHLLMVKQCCPRNNRSGQVINRILNEKGYRFCQKKGLMLIWMPARGWQQYNHQARQQKNINTNSLQTVGIWAAVIYPVPIQDPAVIVSSNIYHWQNLFLFVSLCWQDRN